MANEVALTRTDHRGGRRARHKISPRNSLIEDITYNFGTVKLTRVILFAK